MDFKLLKYFILGTTFPVLMTSLGASFVYLFKRQNKKLLNVFLGFSCGIMLSSSIFSLLIPSIEESEFLGLNTIIIVASGLILGSLFMVITNKLCSYNSKSLMIILSMILHNIPEGASIGIAFGSVLNKTLPLSSAISLSIAIGIQNIPEGSSISIPLYNNGYKKHKACFYGILSGLIEAVFSILGFILVTISKNILPISLSFACGTMLFVLFYELIPESQNNNYKNIVSISSILGFILMLILELTI